MKSVARAEDSSRLHAIAVEEAVEVSAGLEVEADDAIEEVHAIETIIGDRAGQLPGGGEPVASAHRDELLPDVDVIRHVAEPNAIDGNPAAA